MEVVPDTHKEDPVSEFDLTVVYRGRFVLRDNSRVVTVNHAPLTKIPTWAFQFEWGSTGTGSFTLAQSILYHFFVGGDLKRRSDVPLYFVFPWEYYAEAFAREYVSGWAQFDEWELPGTELAAWIDTQPSYDLETWWSKLDQWLLKTLRADTSTLRMMRELHPDMRRAISERGRLEKSEGLLSHSSAGLAWRSQAIQFHREAMDLILNILSRT